jgi:flagellar motor switch protein FliM
MLEPIRDKLDAGIQSDRDEVDERWTDALREELLTAEVEVSSNLIEMEMKLRDVMEFKEGDIIPVELPDYVVLKAEDTPCFRADYGVSNGYMALKIREEIPRDHILRSILDSDDQE